MSVVDLVLIALALLFALSGFRQGLLVSATSIVGFLGGAVLGAQLSGAVADRIDGSSVTRVFAALVVVLAGALLGQILAGAIGRAVRRKVTWEPAKMVDSVAGAVVSGLVVAVLENFGEGYIGKGLKEIVGFVAIVIVMMVRPYGLFGTKEVERV